MIKAYVSHSICGKFGVHATDEQIQENSKKAIAFASEIRKAFANIEFYIPAEHENFVHRAYKNKLLTVEEILLIDCEIISDCDLVVVYAPDQYISNGMGVEIKHCVKHNIPIVYVTNENDIEYLDCVLERFKK